MDWIAEAHGQRFLARPYSAGDNDGVLNLWKTVFHKDMDLGTWRWKYLENPYGHRIFLCAADDGAIVALYGGIPYRFNLDGEDVEIIHLMDLMSHPDYRGKGLFVRTGHAFFDAYCKKEGASFLFGFPGTHHFQLGQKYLGYEAVKAGCVFLVAETAALAKRKKSFGGKIQPLSTDHDTVDPIWEECRSHYPLSIIRDADFVRWRFDQHPSRKYEIWGWRPFARGGPRAYAVFQTQDDHALLMDILASPAKSDAVDLVARVASLFQKRGIQQIHAWLPSNHFLAQGTISAGFHRAPEPTGIIPGLRLFDHSPSLDWISDHLYYTMADADLF